MLEAEFHAVWQMPNGQIIDIAPKAEPSKRILFLKDSVRVFQNKQLNNIRYPLTGNPIILEFINTLNQEYSFLNDGDRAEQFGEIQISGQALIEYERIQAMKQYLQFQIADLIPAIWPEGPCPCGSGMLNIACHDIRCA